MGKILGDARQLLEKSQLNNLLKHEKVFICDSPGLYRLFSPRASSSFAISVPVTDHVFIASADIEKGTAYRFGKNYRTRSLAGLIAHELTHGLIRRHAGLIAERRMPEWIKEGYCEYIAGEGSFPEVAGKRILISGENDPSHSFRYFHYRMVVTYVMDELGMDFDHFKNNRNRFDVLCEETRDHLIKTQEAESY